MSTPTTATTATLPHYSPHHFPYSHHQHQHHQHHPHPLPHQSYTHSHANSSSYRQPAAILPPASRLAYPSPGYSSSAASHTSANGLASTSSSDHSRIALNDAATTSADLTSRLELYTTMPPAPAASNSNNTTTSSTTLPELQPPRKRRRSREPDWGVFYKNGLPKEIIVIDDTPEPDRPGAAPSAAAQTLANGGRQHAATAGSSATVTASSATAAANGANGSAAKKRKRDEEQTPYDPVHHSAAVGSHTPSKSTAAASDRTNSAIHTTAATSLGSLSSNGQYDYDAQPGKRKRTTRQQIANEARRREAAIFTDALAHYRPPPYPPKKARDVHIKVVPDVSSRPRSPPPLSQVGKIHGGKNVP